MPAANRHTGAEGRGKAMSEEQRKQVFDDLALFLQQVDEMRQRQKRYFESSHGSTKSTLLSRAKQQERIVDKRMGRARSLVNNLKMEGHATT